MERKIGGRRRDFNETDLNRLLEVLEKDPDKAGSAYVLLLERLHRFFEYYPHTREFADILADATIDRLIARLSGDGTPAPENTSQYALGIARNVAREAHRIPGHQELPFDLPARETDSDQVKMEDLRQLLDECLKELSEKDRGLMDRYYSMQDDQKPDRGRMAAETGMTWGTLRTTTCRIRYKLTECVHRRMRLNQQ